MRRLHVAVPLMLSVFLWGVPGVAQSNVTPFEVGTFQQQVAEKYTQKEGLPSNSVLSIAVTPEGAVAGTPSGVARLEGQRWSTMEEVAVPLLAVRGSEIFAVAEGALYSARGGDVSEVATVPSGATSALAAGDTIFLGGAKGLFKVDGWRTSPVEELNQLLGADLSVRDIATGPNGLVAVAAMAGLYERGADGAWLALHPVDGPRSWAPRDVRAVAYDQQGRLWFASPQGVGCRGGEGWKLYTGSEGLPYNDFTSMAASPDGSVWFGTRIGAIRFHDGIWEYRQGLRWLPNDEVRDVVVAPNGDAWFATAGGVGAIKFVPMTLAKKARMFEEAIDKYHRRTPYEYVLQVHLPAPGDLSSWTQTDSDNDGLWTSMYGAGECFAYAVTKDPYHKERAAKAFKALKFLMDVTQGGTPPAQPGFVARTILPTSGPNPNETNYTLEKDRRNQERDKLWKVMNPRWGTSADGQWYWKSDTSSDELDGHYFFHALYFDLVAETPEEKAESAKVIAALTDHLIRNNFQLIDHDGQATRWAVYNPERFNQDPWWSIERGLNSLSILSYLATAHHMTGDQKYKEAFDKLVKHHGYHINLFVPKFHTGLGSGNHSDDEMAFMSFYNLLNYTSKDDQYYDFYAYSWWYYWQMERPELNPLFNYMAGAFLNGRSYQNPFSSISLDLRGEWLKESADTLIRWPLDRVNWAHRNDHRLDIVRLPDFARDPDDADLDRPFRKGHRVDGKVVPIDERFVEHWNMDPWALNQGGNGTELADGASFLLPYYMGLYHGFIVEK